jgi:hypothetical protein
MSILSQINYNSKIKFGGEFGRRGSEFREEQNPEEDAIRRGESGLRNAGNKKMTSNEKAQSLSELASRTKEILESMQNSEPKPGAEEINNYRDSFLEADIKAKEILRLELVNTMTQEEIKAKLAASKAKRQNSRLNYLNRNTL